MDIPVPGDYDGLGHTEMAVFRPSTAQWFVMGPTGGHLRGTFGGPNFLDIPAPGDYDGLGHTEMAVFRPSTAQWFVMGPSGGRLMGTFGALDLVDLPTETSVGALKALGLVGGGQVLHASAVSVGAPDMVAASTDVPQAGAKVGTPAGAPVPAATNPPPVKPRPSLARPTVTTGPTLFSARLALLYHPFRGRFRLRRP
jgi:hypothetical protein